MTSRSSLIVTILFYFVSISPPTGWGHPLGNFSLNHYTLIEFYPGEIVAHHILDFAEIPSYSELANLDTNGDNLVSPDEIQAYRESFPSRFVSEYTFDISEGEGIQRLLQPTITDRNIILSQGQGALTCLQIQIAVSFKDESLKKPGTYRLFFQDHNLTHLRGVQQIRIQQHPAIQMNQAKLSEFADASVTAPDENIFLAGGLKATIDYTISSTDSGNTERKPVDILSWIDPQSIPQFPIKPDGNGFYPIVKSPIQPNQEVQAQIALLKPRMTLDASEIAATQDRSQPPTPAPGANEKTVGEDSTYTKSKTDSAWSDMIGAKELSPTFVIVALCLSVIFGASHALSPGHGKTVVAAYLVGSRGTVLHAIFLGLIVTMTHVSSVLLMGLITLFCSQYIVPDKLYPIIEMASGWLIIGIGVSIFLKRFAAMQRIRFANSLEIASTTHSHSHHHHNHEHPHAHDHTHSPDHDHSHDHDHPHNHNHNHPHDHDHPYNHNHNHSHDHEHTHHDHDHEYERPHHHGFSGHEHGPGTHTHDIPADATWKDLLILGVTGGIVPCPSAIVVLVAAISLHRILFGMLMIVFFSLGLAGVLIAIGILMVTAKQWLNRHVQNDRPLLWLQILSPILVTILGFVIFIRGLISGNYISFNF